MSERCPTLKRLSTRFLLRQQKNAKRPIDNLSSATLKPECGRRHAQRLTKCGKSSRTEYLSPKRLSTPGLPHAMQRIKQTRVTFLTPLSPLFQTPSRSHKHSSRPHGFSTKIIITASHHRCSSTISPATPTRTRQIA